MVMFLYIEQCSWIKTIISSKRSKTKMYSLYRTVYITFRKSKQTIVTWNRSMFVWNREERVGGVTKGFEEM